MAEGRRRRVLVAVEPLVLEGAFAAILELIGMDDVVQFHVAGDRERRQLFDAAIVTGSFSDEARADVVITLPDVRRSGGPTNGHRGHVTTAQLSDDVEIRDQGEVIRLLDEHVPAALPRSERLHAG